MGHPALATVEQVGAILRIDLEPDDATAGFLVSMASDIVRGYIDQVVTRVVDDVELVTPHNGWITLKQRPVLSVSKLERNEYATDNWTEIPVEEYWTDIEGGRIRAAGTGNYYGYPYWAHGWPTHERSFRVTYTHGWEVIPDGLAGATALLAARLYNTPPGILNERNGQRGATFQAEQLLSPLERLALGPYRDARIS